MARRCPKESGEKRREKREGGRRRKGREGVKERVDRCEGGREWGEKRGAEEEEDEETGRSASSSSCRETLRIHRNAVLVGQHRAPELANELATTLHLDRASSRHSSCASRFWPPQMAIFTDAAASRIDIARSKGANPPYVLVAMVIATAQRIPRT